MSIESIISAIAQASEIATSGDKLLKGAVGIIDTIKNKTKGPEPASNEDLRALVVDLAEQIANAKMANAMLKVELVELKEAALKQQREADEFARYELWKSPRGTAVLRIKESARGDEPSHYICPNCKEDGKKSILQGHEKWVECPRCKTGFPLAEDTWTSYTVRSRSGWDDLDL